MPQWGIVKINGLGFFGLDRFACRGFMYFWLGRCGNLSEFQTAFADSYYIRVIQQILELCYAVYKNVIYAAKKLAILDITVDDLKVGALAVNERMLARDAAIVQYDI